MAPDLFDLLDGYEPDFAPRARVRFTPAPAGEADGDVDHADAA